MPERVEPAPREGNPSVSGSPQQHKSQELQRGSSISRDRSPQGGSAACGLSRCLHPCQRFGAGLGGPEHISDRRAVVLFTDLLCLWQEGGHHYLPGEEMQAQFPLPLRPRKWMHLPILWAAQVRADGPHAGPPLPPCPSCQQWPSRRGTCLLCPTVTPPKCPPGARARMRRAHLCPLPYALGAGAEQDGAPSAMPWELLILSPQEAWEAFLAQGWEKTVFAQPRPFVRPPHSSVFVRPRPCSQGLCLGKVCARLRGLVPVTQTEHARALGWGIHGEGMGRGTCAHYPCSSQPPRSFG